MLLVERLERLVPDLDVHRPRARLDRPALQRQHQPEAQEVRASPAPPWRFRRHLHQPIPGQQVLGQLPDLSQLAKLRSMTAAIRSSLSLKCQ